MKRLLRKFLKDIKIKKQAEELGIPVWQTPSLLFILMGILIIAVMAMVYFISQRYDAPEVLVISETAVVIILLTIGNFIIQGVEQIAKINKMKSEFVSIASHQLKAPLAEINWEIELLLSRHNEGLGEKQKELIERVSRSNERMGRLVNDLLDVARIDQGKLALDKEKINLPDLIVKVIQNNKILAQANNVSLNFTRPKDNIEVLIDRRRIGVVLDNLISNAIKYITKKGKVSIFAKSERSEVVVCIKDNGIGIPKTQQEHVFEKFFRSDNVARHQVAGTGLGLFISKNVVEQSGGRIWFKSEEDVGSEFCFSLPINSEVDFNKF